MKNESTKNRESARIVAGLILVGVGVAYLLRNLGYILPGWLFTWPMILILVGIYSGVKHNFRNATWAILMAVGGIFLAGNFYHNINFDRAFWPIVIIGAGLMFILRPKRDRWVDRKSSREKFNSEYIDSTVVDDEDKGALDSSDFLYADSVFSGLVRNMMSKNFQGGRISCVFGGAEIDFMQADIHGTVTLKIDLVFGGAKIVVPANWTIVNQIDGVFHGVDDKRKNATVLPDPSKTLILKGSAVFGGVDIRIY